MLKRVALMALMVAGGLTLLQPQAAQAQERGRGHEHGYAMRGDRHEGGRWRGYETRRYEGPRWDRHYDRGYYYGGGPGLSFYVGSTPNYYYDNSAPGYYSGPGYYSAPPAYSYGPGYSPAPNYSYGPNPGYYGPQYPPYQQ